MDLVNIFRKPEQEISNINVLKELMGKPSSFFAMFVAGARIVDNKIEIERESAVFEYIHYIVEKERVYSDYATTMSKILIDLFVSDKNKEYPSLVMGYYDKNTDQFVCEGFIKDFYKINSIDIIDYYFTMKHQDVFYSKDFFEKEYFSAIQKLLEEEIFGERISYEDFKYFFDNVLKFMSKNPINNLNHLELNDSITRLLRTSFPKIVNHVEQKQLSYIFNALGIFTLRLLPEYEDKLIDPQKDKIYANKRYKEVFTISSRAKKIWKYN